MTDARGDEQDERAQDTLQQERYDAVVGALYNAAMLGLPEDELATLCSECGVKIGDVDRYVQPILRMTKERDPTLAQCPF